jgi:hypothetical protein
VVLSAGRTDIIDALVARRIAGGEAAGPGALILCGEEETDSSLVEACSRLSLPLYRTDSSAGKASSVLSGRTFKVEPGESGKIEETVKLIGSAVDMEAVMEILRHPPEGAPVRPRRMLARVFEKPATYLRRVFRKKEKKT